MGETGDDRRDRPRSLGRVIPQNDNEPGDDNARRTRANLAAAAVLLVLGVAILWVTLALSNNQRTQACLQSGRKTCQGPDHAMGTARP